MSETKNQIEDSDNEFLLHHSGYIDDKHKFISEIDQYKVSINIEENDGKTPLEIFSELDNVHKVKLRVSTGYTSCKTLVNICQSPQIDLHKLIFDKTLYRTMNKRDQTGILDIRNCLLRDQTGILDIRNWLLQGGGLGFRDRYNKSLLHYACRYSTLTAVQYLADDSCYVNCVGGKYYRTPLFYCCYTDVPQAVEKMKILVTNGANLDVTDINNKSLLHVACTLSTVDVVQYLADNNCNVNCVGDKHNRTPVFYCCQRGVPQALEKMKVLVSNGVNLDGTDINNDSLLHVACKLSTVDVVEYLADNCQVNCVGGKNDRTPVFYCCYTDVPQAVKKMKVLVSNGGNLDATDIDNTSPLHIACALSTVDVVQYLVDNKCNVNCVGGEYNRAPVLYCCYKDVQQAVEKMKVLVSNGVNLDVTDIDNASPLHLACELSTVDVVQYLIDNKCNVNCEGGEYNRTPVFYCYNKDVPQAVEKIKVLVSNGAKLDVTDIYNVSPLHIACALSTVDVVQYLIDNKCNVNCEGGEYNRTPVFYCCYKDVPQAVEKIKVLVSNGAKLDVTYIDNVSPLHIACALSTVDVVQYLIDNKCNVNCEGGEYNRTPVFYCCYKDVPQAVEKIKVLVSNGAKLDVTDIDNVSPLHIACALSTVDVVQYLIDNKCNVNCEGGEYNRTPVFYCYNKDVPQAVEKIKVLVSNGAKLDVTDIDNVSPLHIACALSTVDVVQYLIDNKCNVNCVGGEYNKAPVLYCCYKDVQQAVEKIKVLVSNGAKLDVTDIYNVSPLHIACALSTVDVVQYLIDNKCNVNCVDTYNRTPAFYCCQRGVPQAVEKIKVLVSNGAKLDVTDVNNRSLLNVACALSTVDVVQYLIDNNCNVNCVEGRYNRTPVFCCCFKDVPQAVEKMKILVSNGAKLDVTDKDNTSLLHIACWLSTVDVVQYLIDNNCNVNCVDTYNRTPAFYCCQRGVPQAVEKIKVLVSNGAKLDVTDVNNRSLLNVACALSTVDVVQYLIDNNCNVNCVEGRYNRTPVFCCCFKDVPQAIEKMKVLVSNRAHLDVTNKKNTSPLHIACWFSTVDVVRYLIKNNCNVNCVIGKYNRTPIFYCCYKDVPQAVEKMKVLVSNGAKLDVTDKDNTSLLHIACWLSTVDVVQYLIDNNCNVNCVDTYNRTPVFNCCFKERLQQIEKIKVLVSYGVNLDVTDIYNVSPLHIACMVGTVDVVQYLIDNKCNVNCVGGEYYRTPVFYCCEKDVPQAVEKMKVLVSYGVTLDVTDKDNTSPLHLACALSTVDVVQYLVDNNCNVNCEGGRYNRTPVVYCCQRGVPQAVEKMKVLVSNGANLDIMNKDNVSPLHQACFMSTVDVVQYLADNNCNVNCVGGEYNTTPVFYCCQRGVPQAVEKMKVLVSNGAKLDVTDINNTSLLHIACWLSTVDVVQYLIDNNCNVNCVDTYNRTPVFNCCFKERLQQIEKIKVLVSYGVNLDVTDIYNVSPLHIACMVGTVDVVQYLIDNKCNVNCVGGEYYRTPVFYCCEKDVPQAVEKMKVLVSNGVKLDVTDKDNTSPLHIACKVSTVDVVQYLVDNNCKVNCVGGKYNRTPVYYCCQRGVPQAVEKMKVLVSNGANLDIMNKDNVSLLHQACFMSTVDVVEYLVDNKCNVNCVDAEYNTTPVFYCCQRGVPQAVEKIKVLVSNGAKLDVTDVNNRSLLNVACALSTVDVVQYLIDNNCNVNCVEGRYNRTPVFCCCFKDVPQAVEKMKILVSNGARLDSVDAQNFTLLHLACELSTVEVVKYLIDSNCYVNYLGGRHNIMTIFYSCCVSETQRIGKIKLLLSRGAKLNRGQKLNCIEKAKSLGYYDTVQFVDKITV